MRKIYSALLCLFIFSTFNTRSNAQTVGTYVFSPSSGTYTALTGTTTSSAIDDDGTQNVALGFNFVFGGVTYPNAVISTNGAIKLAADGATAFATSWTNNLSNAYGFPIIGPAWDDNNATGGSVVYVTAGTAPNRTFSVEWINIHMGGGGSTATPTATFQLKLSEGSNAIQFVYGTINPLTSSTIGIGLNDLVSFLSVTPGTPATASSTTANNSVASAANMPSGTTYTFFPPPPCVPGSLSGGTTQGPAGAQCPGNSFNLSVTGASFGSGLTYQWESSTDNTNWFPIGSATAQGLTTSTLVNTYYRRKMTCSGTDAFSTSFLVTVTAPIPLPVSEGFNTSGTTVFPTCWSQQIVTGTGAITFQTNTTNPTTTPFEGTRYVYWNSFSIANNSETRLVSPAIVTTGTTSVDVQFYWNNDNRTVYSTGQYLLEGVQVQYSLDGTTWVDAGSFIPRHDPSLAAGVNQWKLKKVTLPAVAGNQPSILIGFKFHSGFGDNCSLDAVNILSTPVCVEPSGLSITNITTTSATLNWIAPASAPACGYQWELRTSGAAGSGAVGLAASGATAAGIVTANALGLTANTAYTLYVRGDCCAGSFSSWTAGTSFNTLCNAVNTFPFTETFEAASTTRSCWSPAIVSGSVNWTYGAGAGNGGNITTAHGGTVNARHYGAGTGSVARLISPSLNFSAMPAQGAQVTFWYANQNWLGDQNELRIYYKTSAAGAWTLIPGAVYTTDVGVWTQVELILPSSSGPSDYYIAFEGTELFGWGVAVDDVTIAVAPTCPKPTNITAIGISPTAVEVSFTPPAVGPTVGYIVEYGAPGFTPGTTNTPGVGGTVVFGSGSPITVTGLTASTTYDFYVRKICVAGVDFSVNTKATTTTLCPATNIPHLQNFETATPPAGFPTCTSMQDVNGNSGPDANVTGGRWTTFAGTSNQTYVSPTRVLRYIYDLANPARGADDWFFLQGLNLTGGTSYRLKFFFKASDGPTWTERLEVKYGTEARASAMTNLLYTNNNIATAIASPWDSATVDFTPVANGVYYIGFHAMSLPDQAFLYIDDVSVKLAPLVDVGVSGLTLPSLNCPTTSPVFVQATVTNYNTSAVNFATYPVTVTANITGAATGTLTTVLNTGTLAPGASTTIYLSPSFNFNTGGIYNITATTSTTPASNDPETGNDSYTTSITVNPNPPVPVITPANAAVCIGTPVQLSTQFTASPPPVVHPAVSSGTIAVPIPDNSPAGVSHTLAVSGVPAGASITGISVTINATHTWNSDLIFNLRAPNNNILNLVNGKGGSGDGFTNCIISSASTNPLPAANTTPVTGTFAPDAAIGVGPGSSNVGTFIPGLSLTPNGNWTLSVSDNAGLDVGTLTNWSITITYQVLSPTLTWTPATGLYTNAGATTAYTGGNAYSVYANPAGTTTYTATATTAAGCTSSATATVTVNPYPVITIGSIPDTVCISDPLIQLPASPLGGSWSGVGVSGNTFVPPATAVGTYILTYTYTSAAGCTSTATKKIAVKDCPERIILLSDNALILFPNPNTGQFNIRINSVLYNNLTMKVYANNGTLVRTQQLSGLAWGRVVPIDLRPLSGGLYFVKFYYDGGARTAEKSFKVMIGTD